MQKFKGILSKYVKPTLILATLLSSTVLASGCSARNTVEFNSPEAELSYAYLALELAVRENDLERVNESAEIFLRYAPDAPPLIDIATWYLVMENHVEARKLIEKLTKIRPSDMDLRLLLAETLVESGMDDEAIDEMKKFIKDYSQNTAALFELAYLYMRLERYHNANEIFASFSEEQLTPVTLYYSAMSLRASGYSKLAKTQLIKALEKQSDFYEAIRLLASIEEEEGDIKKAIEHYTILLENEQENVELITRLIYLHVIENNIEKGYELAKTTEEPLLFLLHVIPLLMEQGYYDASENLIEYAKDKDTNLEELLFYQAAIEFEKNRDALSALKYLYQISEKSDNYYRALSLIIELEIIEGMYPEALFHAKKGLEIFGDDIQFFLLVIQLNFAMDQKEEAFNFTSKKVDELYEDRDTSSFAVELLYNYSGMLFIEKRGEESVKYIERILEIDPEHYEAMNTLAYHYAVEDKKLTTALDLINTVIKNSEPKAHFYDTLAWVQYRMGDYKDALKNVQKAMDLVIMGEIDPTILEHYGFIALELGQKDKAKLAFLEALKGTPENPEDIKRALEQL